MYKSLRPRADIVAALVGFLIFLILSGGGAVLVPTYIGWLMVEDAATHWIGWEFFRSAPFFQWPIGLNPYYGEGLNNTIVFSDSIPLMAIIFKLFSSFLPEKIQYTGLWVSINFSLQAYFSFKIMKLLTDEVFFSLLCSVFFVLSMPFLVRNTGHYALGAHWLLLSAFYLFLSPRKGDLGWVLLLLCASLVHAYLLVMTASIWTCDVARRAVYERRNIYVILLTTISIIAIVCANMWAVGYFAVKSVSIGGYGYYRLNIISALDPSGGWSQILRNQSTQAGDGEGAAFLGLGVIVLGIIALATIRKPVVEGMLNSRVAFAGLLSLALGLFAISNRIALGSLELAHYELPASAEPLFNAFRASGRFVWPVFYLFLVAIFVTTIRSIGRRRATIIVSLALVIQSSDSLVGYRSFHAFMNARADWHSPLQHPIWGEVRNRYTKVNFIVPQNHQAGWDALAFFAVSNNMTINTGYFARVDEKRLAMLQEEMRRRVLLNDFDKNTVYIVDDDSSWQFLTNLVQSKNLLTVADGFRLLLPNWNECAECESIAAPLDKSIGRINYGFADGLAQFSGWSHTEPTHRWSIGPTASVILPLPQGFDRIGKCIYIRGSTLGFQHIDLSVNGVVSSRYDMTGGGVMIAPIGQTSGEVEIGLQFSNPQQPSSLDKRLLAFALQGVEVSGCH